MEFHGVCREMGLEAQTRGARKSCLRRWEGTPSNKSGTRISGGIMSYSIGKFPHGKK